MAQKIQTLFIDDLDGSQAEGTIRFGLDGTEYEIDLSTKHAEALRTTLARYTAAARRNPGSAARQPGKNIRRPSLGDASPRTRTTRASNSEMRDWARTQGMDVKDRGRIPAELVVKFKAATGK